MESTTRLRCLYVTGFTYDKQTHLQLAPGAAGSCAFSDEGFTVIFDAGNRLRIPADTIRFVEIRGDDEKHRDAAVWESGLLAAAVTPPSDRAYFAVGRADGADIIFEVPGETATDLRRHLQPLGEVLRG